MICEISLSLLCIDMLVYKPRAVFCFISKRVGKLTRMISWADIFTVQQSYYCGWYHKGVLADGWSCAGMWFCSITRDCLLKTHDDVIKWKNFLRYWPFVRGIHRSPVNSSHKGQWRGAFDVFFDQRLNKRLNKQPWVFKRDALYTNQSTMTLRHYIFTIF